MKFAKIIVLSIVVLYFQIFIVPQFPVAGNYFNILLPLIILISEKCNFNFALILTFFIALSYDVTYPYTFGLNGIIFLIIVFVLMNYRNYFNFSNFFILMLIAFSVNIFYYFSLFTIFLFSGEKSPMLSFSFVLMITLNTIITTLLYFLYSFLIKLEIHIANEQQ